MGETFDEPSALSAPVTALGSADRRPEKLAGDEPAPETQWRRRSVGAHLEGFIPLMNPIVVNHSVPLPLIQAATH